MTNSPDPLLTIIWDWNGTLLADVPLCIDTMNSLLSERGLPLLNLTKYHNVFDFPVINYYQKLGFDFETDPFEVIGLEFMKRYLVRLEEAGLVHGAAECLEYFKGMGYRQAILSAMEETTLQKTLTEKGILSYFTEVAGIGDHYGGSKLESGKRLLKKLNIDTNRTWLIGDTLHDAEVAEQLGCRLVLIAHGHHSADRLSSSGATVVKDFSALKSFFETETIQLSKFA
jgi:phosphoglycolate phosphatase